MVGFGVCSRSWYRIPNLVVSIRASDTLYKRFSHHLDPWNPLIKTMREGEIRRVWLKRSDRAEPVVFEIELASVVRTDAAGEPIIDNR